MKQLGDYIQHQETLTNGGSHAEGDVETCETCGETITVYRTLDGIGMTIPCHVDCACERKQASEDDGKANYARRQLAYDLSQIPGNLGLISFENWNNNSKLKQLGERFCSQFASLRNGGIAFTLSGGMGIGKTHMLLCVVNRLSDMGYRPLYTNHQELLGRIKATFDSCESEAAIMRRLASAHLVVLDELGVGIPSKWNVGKTYEIVDTLYRRGIPILAATNLSQRQLSTFFADEFSGFDRITPRLFERSPFYTITSEPDWRHTKTAQAKARIDELLAE